MIQRVWSAFFDAILEWHCFHFHSGVLGRVNGYYRCEECLRQYPIPHELEAIAKQRETQHASE